MTTINPTIKQAIKQAIIDSYNAKLESVKREHEYRNHKFIGEERTDFSKIIPIQRIEFINPATGRINHKTLRNQYAKYIYTQEKYDEELAKKIEELKPDCQHSFQINTDDSVRILRFADALNPTDEDAEHIYNAYGKWAEHLTGFEIEWYTWYGNHGPSLYSKVNPIFDTNEFWDIRKDYMDKKAAWCSKYGCD